ncbi:hypothetical protein [Caballeronia sp. LZ001]|uniref:hypothetical protein n=1 Tax=Caballeronia sp. LZ001 TaxID=3038553 RepID=UPI00285768E8|nr:hypothetical protein [Caballeronia sp. LZ001]MDR5804355.1 hypothetical protein [Caballeronia sp. LZ001]
MTRSKNAVLAAVIAGTLASVSVVSFAQTTSDQQPSSADKKALKKQAEANKDAAVAQAKADKKKTEAQSEANEAAADAKLKNAKKAD